ncbi:MAG: hypothetical protein J3K34DRAFT_444125 [Monoraphidium minutum]|nr:MAG: hypothetical protein J3K34DRAFT_444125 [Monoraphidium minutum]
MAAYYVTRVFASGAGQAAATHLACVVPPQLARARRGAQPRAGHGLRLKKLEVQADAGGGAERAARAPPLQTPAHAVAARLGGAHASQQSAAACASGQPVEACQGVQRGASALGSALVQGAGINTSGRGAARASAAPVQRARARPSGGDRGPRHWPGPALARARARGAPA